VSADFDTYPTGPITKREAMRLLEVGPDFELFRGFASLGEVRADNPNLIRFGVVHWYFDADGNPRRTVQTFLNVESARWALEHLYRTHPDDCRCVAIFYFTPAMVNYGAEQNETAEARGEARP
jgi:hypothetical protein